VKRHILITGGAGFIGSHLVDRLLSEKSWQVSVVDNLNDFYSPQIKRDNIGKHLNSPEFSLYEADIRCRESLRRVFAAEKYEAIVHLAACAGVQSSLANPALYVQTNVDGTLNVLELAREFGVRQFVFGSSSSIYGINCKIPFSEEDKISKTISPYAATKAAGEMLCHTYSHLYDIRTVCLRFFTVYGARQRPDLAIHKFSRMIWQNLPVTMFGDGTTRRDYTYIDDIIEGIRAAIDYRKSVHEIFNLGESQTVELRYLIELLEKNLGIKAIVEKHGLQPGDVPVTFADISKAKQILGYNPQTKIEDGIPKFVRWFRENRGLSFVESAL
jgi:UDP-glucuronate 4-epimerase